MAQQTRAEYHANGIVSHLINATVTSAVIDRARENFGLEMLTEDGRKLVVWFFDGMKIVDQASGKVLR